MRTLLIEDSPTQAAALAATLQPQGFDVKLAPDLAAGLAALGSFDPEVVLLDLILPDARGLDGVERLHAADRLCPIVILTSVEDESLALQALQAGAQDYVIKGSQDATLLVRTIRYAVERAGILRRLDELTEELRTKNVKLEQLDEQKDRFLGMAAHDLRNPLGVVMVYSRLLLGRLREGLTDDQVQFISTIQSNSEFMLQLVNDLLDISTIADGKIRLSPEPTDLSELCRRNVGLNAVLARDKNIEIRFEEAGGLPLVRADGPKLEQVLNNLISNAVKFSHPDTTVAVELERDAEDAVVRVSDQGQGIPADELENLFDPLAKKSVRSTGGEKSTGLGLVIVKNIISGHGGRIDVESEVGKGTTFRIRLPLAGPPGD